MDHYKTLGLSRDATKEEIKEAFRRSALKFHPDRHSQSSKEVRDGASLRFKQASEAYEVLTDDRKRADYDRCCRGGSFDRWGGAASASSSYSSYYGRRQYGYGGGGSYRPPPPPRGRGAELHMDFVFRYLTKRGFLVNVAFASALLGGAVLIERSVEAIWEMNNSGLLSCALLSGRNHMQPFIKVLNTIQDKLPMSKSHVLDLKSFQECIEKVKVQQEKT